ncbi:MAG: PD-(D/E)XK nuclease family protein [Acidimicrobiales bacterium]
MNVDQVAAGRPFTLAVSQAVVSAKGGQPLAPVTVVVPSNLAGLSLRRVLGSGLLASADPAQPRGIVNVAFATPFQYASTLAAPALARSGRRPLTTAVLAAAVRHVLRASPGRFEAVAQHTATETALVRAYGELTELSASQRTALAAGGTRRTADLVAFVNAVAEHLESDGAGYHDESAVFASAVSQLHLGAETTAAPVVLAGPFDQGEATLTFLAEIGRSHRGSAVLALTGDRGVDELALAQMGAVVSRPLSLESVARPVPTTLVPVADSDEEVRAVVRDIVDLAERGQRFDRMAIFHPSANPYARSIREQLDLAGIPSAGPDHRRIADSMVGRLLSELLGLATRDSARTRRFSRGAVLAFASAAPIHGPGGSRIRSAPWDDVSRKAGVVGGLEDWTLKLARHAKNLDDQITDGIVQERSSGWVDARRRERRVTADLDEFVRWLHDLTDPDSRGSTWAERSTWALGLLATLLPRTQLRSSWPAAEADAADRIEVVLTRVGVLDHLEPDAPYSAFVRAIELELDAPSGTRGSFGTGVLVAPLSSAAGLDLDHIFVLGLAEGVCPRPVREDTLLPDTEREIVDGALVTRTAKLELDRRRYLTALAAGAESVTLVHPAGDHRNGRVRTASRWWLEAMRDHGAASDITGDNWAESPVAALFPLRSFHGASVAAAAAGRATSPADHQLHLVVGANAPAPTALAPALRHGIEVQRSRAAAFSRYSGDLGSCDLPAVAAPDAVISASRLESWASCPRRYFFAEHLGLGTIEPPDRIERIAALERGTLVHAILEDFIATVIGADTACPGPGDRWTDDDRSRLHSIADQAFADVEERGITGRPLLWEIDKEAIRSDLNRFLEEDGDLRGDLNSTPHAVEMAFGLTLEPGVEPPPAADIALTDGRTLRMRGLIDRVDLRPDGSPVVIDYKTGSSKSGGRPVRLLLAEDPVVGGTKLQLGVYSEAARQHFGTDRATAMYWYTSEKGRFDRARLDWTSEVRDRFTDVVQVIVDGIEAGLFPPNPGDYDTFYASFRNCGFCEFNSICPSNRHHEHAVAIEDPRLAPWVGLSDLPNLDSAEGSP